MYKADGSITLNKLTTAECQRVTNAAQVKKIVENFNEELFLPIIVSTNADGTYSVIDGKHRYVAASRLGIKKIPCFIVGAKSTVDQAKLFREINQGSLAIKPYDDYKAGLLQQDPEIIAINKIVTEYGYEVKSSSGENFISAITTLRQVYSKYGGLILGDTLRVLRYAYKGDSVSVQAPFIKGIAVFLKHGEAVLGNDFDELSFAKKLKVKEPWTYLRELKGYLLRPFDSVAIDLFSGVYNAGRRKNKI